MNTNPSEGKPIKLQEISISEVENKQPLELDLPKTNAPETSDAPDVKFPIPPETSDPANTEDSSSSSVKTRKGTNYSRDEIKKLLALIQDSLPVTENDWETLTSKFNEGCSYSRTSVSLKYIQKKNITQQMQTKKWQTPLRIIVVATNTPSVATFIYYLFCSFFFVVIFLN